MARTVTEIVAKMRADLEGIGGFEYGLRQVPAIGVAAYIQELETALEAEAVAKAATDESPASPHPAEQ